MINFVCLFVSCRFLLSGTLETLTARVIALSREDLLSEKIGVTALLFRLLEAFVGPRILRPILGTIPTGYSFPFLFPPPAALFCVFCVLFLSIIACFLYIHLLPGVYLCMCLYVGVRIWYCETE